MLNSVQLFDLVKARKGLTSDYQLSKYLDVTAGMICRHRKASFGVDNATALKLGAALEIDPAYIMMCALAESAKRVDEKSALMRVLILCELNRDQLAYGWTARGQKLATV